VSTQTAASFGQAFRSSRAAVVRTPARRRAALVALGMVLGRFAGRVGNGWARVRTVTLSLCGFGCLSAAAWTWHMTAGLAAVGLSLLAIEALGGDRR